MATVTKQEIVHYLKKLEDIYQTVDAKSLKKEIDRLREMINSLTSVDQDEKTTTSKGKKGNGFRKNLRLLLDKNYTALTGTKLNYEQMGGFRDVIEFFETYREEDILKHATALDLKLLYTILTGEHRELKGKKDELIQTIKRNIRARKRGEAFRK